jgi:flagellar hook-associated protein 2
MASISSTGIGSGLDVNSIVSQLVALEKTPLKTLAVKATNVQAQISAFGDIQSQFAALTDVATRIAAPGVWAARNASSSNASAATITALPTANATTFKLDVDQLAGQQSGSSAALPPGTMPGAGTLTLQLGTWSAGGATFTAGAAASVAVSITATDTIAAIATKINAANSGVVATVFNDGTNERLLLSSKTTGAAAGFRVQSVDAPLAGLVFDPQNKPGIGMAAAGIPVQYGQDAKARINGLAVTSATNTLTDNVPGVTISLVATTTTGYGTGGEVKSPATMRISEDVTPAVKNVSDFVTAYNTLNKTLTDLTKYVASTKTAGLFQGDSSIVGLQNVLRNMLGSSSMGATAQHLSDVGLERQLDGSLTINTAKLSAAANNGTTLQQLFTNNNSDPLTNGFALKFRDLGRGVAASGGSVYNKATVLQGVLDNNTKEQAKVNDRATLFEARLRKQYSALDAQMAQLNALNSYVTQQVATWNKSTA